MKTILAAIVMLISIGSALAMEPGIRASDVAGGPHMDTGTDWLLLVYMAGDNNLGRDGYEWGNAVKMDLEEMENMMPTAGVDILALADMEGANNTFLYDLEKAPARGVNSPTINLSEVNPTWNDELDMSDWRVLRDFLVYGLTERPAERTMFVIWNHGAGWYSGSSSSKGSRAEAPSKGFALDSHSGGAMFLDEFRNAFIGAEDALGSLHMDMIGFDTCSMGMMEVYYQVSPWFDLAIGSEDEQPWYGYNYTFVSVMGGMDPYTPVELGQHIIQEFIGQYLIPGEYPYGAVALVNLTILRDGLSRHLEDLTEHLIERMYHNEVQRNHAFRAVRGRTELLAFENVDLGHFLENLVSSDLQLQIRENASLALSSYNDVVIDEWHQPDGRNPFATGISIYLPPSGSYRTDYDGSEDFLNFTLESSWDEMIREFHEPRQRIKMDLSIRVLDGDDLADDVTIVVTDPRFDTPIDQARIFVDRALTSTTDETGTSVLKDMFPGTYYIEVYNGSNVAESTIKVLNRAPKAIIDPGDPVALQGHYLLIDASFSNDPDGDLLTFKWDLDETDGLDDTDSTSPWVNLSYQKIGNYTIRLTVNDSFLADTLDIEIEVINAPPVAKLDVPPYIHEDEEFIISAKGSWDTYPDGDELRFLYLLNGAPIENWTKLDEITTSIPESGTHQISVRIMDPKGDMGFTSRTIQVYNLIPIANITGPIDVIENDHVQFSANTSTDSVSDLPLLSYEWYLDGNETPISTDITVGLRFLEEDTHVIELKVIDDDGSEDMVAHWFTVWNLEPEASVEPVHLNIFEDDSFILNGSGSMDTPNDKVSLNYTWYIEDGSKIIGYGSILEHSISSSGTYNITLAVTDDQGTVGTFASTVEVFNKRPSPTILGPSHAYEDEEVHFLIGGTIDTPSDMETLQYLWRIDGNDAGIFEILNLSRPYGGNYTINLTVIDDDGDIGYDEMILRISNPLPNIILENVPVEIDEGEEFTAIAYRTFDNPSDMPHLTFDWYLDGELLVGKNTKNLTIAIDDPGTHTLRLVVSDDDGSSEISMDIEVNRIPSFIKFLDSAFSGLVLVMVIVLLVLILVVAFKINRRMMALPKPMKNEETDEEEEEGGEGSEGGKDEGSEDENEDEVQEGVEPPEEDELLDDEDLGGIVLDLSDPPGYETPEDESVQPDFGEVDIPDVDDSIFKTSGENG